MARSERREKRERDIRARQKHEDLGHASDNAPMAGSGPKKPPPSPPAGRGTASPASPTTSAQATAGSATVGKASDPAARAGSPSGTPSPASVHRGGTPPVAPPAAASAAPALPAPGEIPRSTGVVGPRGWYRPGTSACYIDFENVFYTAVQHGARPAVLRMVRHLNRLIRQTTGEGWSQTAVYAHWDAMATHARNAQDEWAMLGWRTVGVPAREDLTSNRVVKNMVDFVMSLDMLEDARDRGYEHITIVSGDSDFCEVVERLKRLGRKVTVVALRPNLSLRLSEAADECVVWGLQDIVGDESLPEASYRRFEELVKTPRRAQGEEPYQVLLRAVRLAERDQGITPVAWVTIRDEYFRRMVTMAQDEADRFVDMLAEAGFVSLVRQRGRDGRSRTWLNIPR